MSSHEPAAPQRERHRWFVLLPALTFVVGLVLGGVLVTVTMTGGDEPGSEALTTPTPTGPDPGASSTGLSVTVPGSCLDAADLSQEALDLADRAASAIQDLDAGELQSLIGDLDELSQAVREAADQCREDAAANTGS